MRTTTAAQRGDAHTVPINALSTPSGRQQTKVNPT
jgi:hypothetical protein